MKKIETLAVKLRDQIGVPDDLCLDSLDVLRRLKISKVISDFVENPNAVGRDAHWHADNRTISLSPSLWKAVLAGNDADARFTVFHEVGHAVLGHTDRNRRTAGQHQFGKSVQPDEMEADEFALAFAAPLKFAGLASDVSSVAKLFGLPIDQASRRLVDLQRHTRLSIQPESDSYAEAMNAMRINALNWNRR